MEILPNYIFTVQPLALSCFFPLIMILLCLLLHVTLLPKLRQFLKLSGQSSPPTYPVLGCLISFYKNRHRLLAWYTDLLSTSATQTVIIWRLGGPKTIITANPENVEYMLKTNFTNFPKGKPFIEILVDFLGSGIFNVDGELWHTQRKLASTQFSSKSLKEHVEKTVKEAVENKLFPVLESLATDSSVANDTFSCNEPKTVDFQELLRRLGFDIVCKLSLGFDPCCLNHSLSLVSPIMKAFDTAGEVCAKRATLPISSIWKIKRMFGVGSEKILKDSVKEIHVYITSIIAERKKNIVNRDVRELESKDLLGRMIMLGVGEEVIRDMVISFIMAGRDTTSAAMTWLFYLLSRHSHVEEELIKELGFGERILKYERLKEMRYLQACLYETMRLYPPISWDSKHAVEDDLLPDGTPVNAGDRVTYFPYGMGRMEKLWGKDRLEFRPDRWFVEPDERGGLLKEVCPYKYPIFHAGPRVCLGKELAFIQMTYMVASIVKRFEIRPVGSEEAVFLPFLTAHMAGGFEVHIRRRQPTNYATCRDKNIMT